jgi:hypothetical protein
MDCIPTLRMRGNKKRQDRQSIAAPCPGFLVENAGQPVKSFAPSRTHNIAVSRSGQSVAVPPCT